MASKIFLKGHYIVQLLLERIILQKVTVVSSFLSLFFSLCNQASAVLIGMTSSSSVLFCLNDLDTTLQNQAMFVLNIIEIGVFCSCWPLHEGCGFQGNIWGPAEFISHKEMTQFLSGFPFPYHFGFVLSV